LPSQQGASASFLSSFLSPGLLALAAASAFATSALAASAFAASALAASAFFSSFFAFCFSILSTIAYSSFESNVAPVLIPYSSSCFSYHSFCFLSSFFFNLLSSGDNLLF